MMRRISKTNRVRCKTDISKLCWTRPSLILQAAPQRHITLWHFGDSYIIKLYTEVSSVVVELDLAAKRAWYTINFRNIERGLVQKSQYNDLEGTITELSSTGDG